MRVSKNISYRAGGRYWSRDWEEIEVYREGHGDGPEDKGEGGSLERKATGPE